MKSKHSIKGVLLQGEYMSEEKVGIENILEVIDALEVLGVGVGSSLKDGKINMADLPILIGMLNDFNVFYKAIEGGKEVLVEGKDIDQAELLQLGARVYEVIKRIIESTKPE